MSAVKRAIRTPQRIELMGHILRAAGEGRMLTVTELYTESVYAQQFSFGALRACLRLMENDEIILRRKVGRSTEIVPTLRGYDWFRPRHS